jgi:exonuclease SbcD
VLEKLVALASTGAKVVAVPGNHDSADLFNVLAPHLVHSGVILVHKPLRPDEGGVITVKSRDEKEIARVACFPFLHEAHIVEFMETHEARHTSYADRVRAICRSYARWMQQQPQDNAVDVLVGHFMIHGAIPSGSERELHIGEAYMATTDAVPHEFDYVALGHIHKPQPAPRSEEYARYAGSLMQLDFGEAGQDKEVVVADVTAQGRKRIESVPLTSGRRLERVRGTIGELRNRADELATAICSVEVVTDGPSAGIAEEVRSFLPDALYVRADYPREEAVALDREGLSLTELYAAYVQQDTGALADTGLLKAFDKLQQEVGVAL